MSEERKALERLICRILGAAAIIAVVVMLLPVFWDKLSPFIVAVPIAAMLQPVIRFLQEKLKLKRSAASLILVLLILALLLILIYWLLSFGITQVVNVLSNSGGNFVGDTVASIRLAVEKVVGLATHLSPDVENWIRGAINDLASDLTSWGTEAAGKIVGFAVSLVTSLPYILIYVSFLVMGLYFIAKDYVDIRSYLPGGKRHNQESNSSKLTNSAIRSLTGYLKVQGTFGLMVWIVSWIYLVCFGFKYAWLIALLAGIMELIPMVGSGLLYIVWGLVSLILGNTATGVEILVLTGVLQLVRRILEPKLMSHSIGISPLLSLIGMFMGLRFGGIMGLIGGPVIMAVLEGFIHGEYVRSVRRDIATLAAYLKKRWAPPEEKPMAASEEKPMAASEDEEKPARKRPEGRMKA